MMIEAIVRSYWRSILRGTRTMEDVPENLREAVRALDPGPSAEKREAAE